MSQGKVLVLASGSRGDAQPYIALCIAMQEVGLQAMIYTNPDHEKLCKDVNVPMEPNTIPFHEAFLCGETNKANQSANFLNFLGALMKELNKNVPSTTEKEYKLIKDYKPDFVICGTLHFVDGDWIYEIFGIPWMIVHLSNKGHANPLEAPFGLPTLCRCWNMFLWKMVLKQYITDTQKGQGKTVSDLSGKPVEELYPTADDFIKMAVEHDPLYEKVMPWCIAQDEDIVGRGVADPPWMTYLGSFVLPTRRMVGDEFGDANKRQLDQFMASGSEPVYIGWGSVLCGTQAAMCGLAVRSLKIAGCRGVILGGWADLTLDVLKTEPDGEELLAYGKQNILLMKTAKHEDLFPRCAVLVHHGGSGTTIASLRSGRPTIITPILYDQFEYAKLMVRKGIGIDAGHLTKVTPDALAGHIKKCMSDDTMKGNAKTVQEEMRKKDGAKSGAQWALKFLNEEVRTGNFVKNKELLKARKQAAKKSGFLKFCAVCCKS